MSKGKRVVPIAVPLLVAATLAACGYFAGGTWEDDPENFQRMLGTGPAEGVEVGRSLYTRYPHWTDEHLGYLQFRAPAEVVAQLIEENGLSPASPPWARPGDAPEWFAPGPIDAYELWAREEGPPWWRVLLRHRESGEIYFYELHV